MKASSNRSQAETGGEAGAPDDPRTTEAAAASASGGGGGLDGSRPPLAGDNPVSQWLALDHKSRVRVVAKLSELAGARQQQQARLVSVFGAPRMGKSTMLNRVGRSINAPGGVGEGDDRKWFGVSHGVDSYTKGVHCASWLDRGVGQAKEQPLLWLDCEGRGDAGEALDNQLLLPLFLLSRVVVWNVRSVAKDALLQAADDLVVAAYRLMNRVGDGGGGGAAPGDGGGDTGPAAASRNIFGHLVVVIRDCSLIGDLTAHMMTDEPVKLNTGGRKRARALAAQQRNLRRHILREVFESVQVVKLVQPADPAAPLSHPAFAEGMDEVIANVRELARRPMQAGPQSLQLPPVAASTAVGAKAGRPTECTLGWLQEAAEMVTEVVRCGVVPSPAGVREQMGRRAAARRREAEIEAEKERLQAAAARREAAFAAEMRSMEQAANKARREMEANKAKMDAEFAALEKEGKSSSAALEQMQRDLEAKRREAQRCEAAARRVQRQHQQQMETLLDGLRKNEEAARRFHDEAERQQKADAKRLVELQAEVHELASRPPTVVYQYVRSGPCSVM